MTADPKRSMPGRHLWCNDQDGQGARYLEFYPGRKQLRQICDYRNGRPAGSFSAWLPGGEPWITGQYLSGKPDGRWEQRDGSGNKIAEAVYRNGQLIAGVPVAGTAACERMAER
jgi:antitoxin component YwqK of YwqJK toxin-antitoxin module